MKTSVTFQREVTWRMTYEQTMVLRPELRRARLYDRGFAKGREDRLLGKPCESMVLGYLDGWYSVDNSKGGNRIHD